MRQRSSKISYREHPEVFNKGPMTTAGLSVNGPRLKKNNVSINNSTPDQEMPTVMSATNMNEASLIHC